MIQRHKLFLYNPPNDDKDIDALFYNRESELIAGVELLPDHVFLGQVYAIHGEPRMGKSHYLRKLINRLKEEKRQFVFYYVNAHNRDTARFILEKIFAELKERIDSLSIEHNDNNIKIAQKLLAEINPLVTGKAKKKTFGSIKENIQRNQISISLLPKFIQASWQHSNESKGGDEIQSELTEVSDNNLLELIKYQASMICKATKRKSVFLAVDDLDLLAERQGNQNEVTSLLDMLNDLAHDNDRLFNILTVIRTDELNARRKDIIPAIKKIAYMDENDIKAIYKKHIEYFNDNKPIFTDDAINYLLKGAENCVGVFLENCHTFLNDISFSCSDNKLIGIDEIKKNIEKNINEYIKSRETNEIMLDIIKHVKDKQMIYSSQKMIPADLLHQVLQKDKNQPQVFYINKLFAHVIMETYKDGD